MTIRRNLALGSSASITLLVVGIVIFATFSSPIERSTLIHSDFISVEPGELKTYDTTISEKYDYVVTFAVSNGSIMTCDPLNGTLWYYLTRDEYSPSWYDSSGREYEFPRDESFPQDLVGSHYGFYFLFNNTELYEKEVHVQVTVYEIVENTGILIIGAGFVVSGLVMGIWLIVMTVKKRT